MAATEIQSTNVPVRAASIKKETYRIQTLLYSQVNRNASKFH